MELRIALEALQGKRASSRVEGGISWFLLSCIRKLGVPLDLPQGPQGTSCIASEKSSLLLNCKGDRRIALEPLQGLGPHLVLRGESPSVSQVAVESFGFI